MKLCRFNLVLKEKYPCETFHLSVSFRQFIWERNTKSQIALQAFSFFFSLFRKIKNKQMLEVNVIWLFNIRLEVDFPLLL